LLIPYILVYLVAVAFVANRIFSRADL
jgi:hypothetical protein